MCSLKYMYVKKKKKNCLSWSGEVEGDALSVSFATL